MSLLEGSVPDSKAESVESAETKRTSVRREEEISLGLQWC